MSLRAEIAAATSVLLSITSPKVHNLCTADQKTADQKGGSLTWCQPARHENEGAQQ